MNPISAHGDHGSWSGQTAFLESDLRLIDGITVDLYHNGSGWGLSFARLNHHEPVAALSKPVLSFHRLVSTSIVRPLAQDDVDLDSSLCLTHIAIKT